MTSVGRYLPGDSLVHRVRAGHKLVALVLTGACSILLDHLWQVGAGLAIVTAGYGVAGIPLRTALAQLRPLVWVAAAVATFHVLANGWVRAAVVIGVIALLVLLAALVTLTSRTTELVDALVTACGPLRRLGVDPERVGLLLALGVRCVPVVVGLAEEVRAAQQARGLTASPRAFAVPLIIRSLRHADTLGEALVARGVED